MCIAGNVVADVRSDPSFRILDTNVSDRTIYLLPQKVVTTAEEDPETIVESQLSHAEVFGLILDDRDTKFQKRHTVT